MRPSSILVALLGAASAAPIDHRLEDIQCRCLSLSTNAKPTLCTHMESHAFDYHTASSLASDYDLEMQFASQDTITKILSIHRPLPSGVLQRISEGQVVSKDATDLLQQQNKIVCGFGDEVKRLGSHDVSLELECHYIGYGVAAFMLLVLVYVVGEYVWMRSSREGSIKLDGDEKTLTAACELQEQRTESDAPATVSWSKAFKQPAVHRSCTAD